MLTDLLKLDRPLVVLDVETHDKVPPEMAYICEIGFIILYPPGGKETKRWVSYVKPPVPISEGATGVHNITNAMVAEAPTWKQLGPNLAKGFVSCDYCGYHVRFDLRATQAEMTRNGIAWSYEGARLVDPLRLWQLGAPRTLTDAVQEFCDRKPTEAHRALGDAEDAMEVAEEQLLRWEQLPRDIQELHDLSFTDASRIDPDGKFIWINNEACFNFGKYGASKTLLKNAPRSYLEWILTANFPPEVKRIVENAINGRYPEPVLRRETDKK